MSKRYAVIYRAPNGAVMVDGPLTLARARLCAKPKDQEWAYIFPVVEAWFNGKVSPPKAAEGR